MGGESIASGVPRWRTAMLMQRGQQGISEWRQGNSPARASLLRQDNRRHRQEYQQEP